MLERPEQKTAMYLNNVKETRGGQDNTNIDAAWYSTSCHAVSKSPWFVDVCGLSRQVVECLRRLVLTGLLVFLVPDTPGQIAFSCVFAFARYDESHRRF